jgi:hypothetical protein
LASANSREEVLSLVEAFGGCGTGFILFLVDDRLRLLDARKLPREGAGIQGFPTPLAVRLALDSGAAGMLIVQERDDPLPRRPDIELTIRVRETLAETGIELLDHLLISGGTVSACRPK